MHALRELGFPNIVFFPKEAKEYSGTNVLHYLFQYTAEFGTDHVYNTDTFNEMTPKSRYGMS